MGPHPTIMHVLTDDRGRLVQRELVRQSLLNSEILARPTRATPWRRQVTSAVASLAATPWRAPLRLSRIVGLLFVNVPGTRRQ